MSRRPTSRTRLVDVAAAAGVSPTVVSAVLRNHAGGTIRVGAGTAEQIRRLAAEMNYQPNAVAQQLKGKRSDVLGVLIGAKSTAANYGRLEAIEEEAYQRGYRLMIGEFRADPERTASYVRDFLSRGIEALVCFHNPLPQIDEALLELLAEVPSLVFQTQAPLEQACCVDVDRAAGVRAAIGHLRERGRRRIALALNCPPEDDPLMGDRLRGYTEGLDRAGWLEERGADLVWLGQGKFPPPAQLVDQAVRKLVIDGRADAIIASNDVWAIELIKGIRRQGRKVPRDVAMVGFDNLDAAALFDPALTTIDQNDEAFATAAVDLLLGPADGQQTTNGKKKTAIVQPRLVVREST